MAEETAYAASSNADPAGFTDLDAVYNQMKQNVENLKYQIELKEKAKKQTIRKIYVTSDRHKRVSERLAQRLIQQREYKRVIDAVESGYNNLKASGAMLLEVLRSQMQDGQNKVPQKPEIESL